MHYKKHGVFVLVVLMLHQHKTQHKPQRVKKKTQTEWQHRFQCTIKQPSKTPVTQNDGVIWNVCGQDEMWLLRNPYVKKQKNQLCSGEWGRKTRKMAGREFGRQGEERIRNGRKVEQGTGLTYMRREGLQGGKSLLWERTFPFRVIGLEAWARLIHWHGPTGPRRLSPLQGGGAGGVGVVWGAGAVINIGWALPPERGVLALQRLKLEETVSDTRRALSKSKLGCLSWTTWKHRIVGPEVLVPWSREEIFMFGMMWCETLLWQLPGRAVRSIDFKLKSDLLVKKKKSSHMLSKWESFTL